MLIDKLWGNSVETGQHVLYAGRDEATSPTRQEKYFTFQYLHTSKALGYPGLVARWNNVHLPSARRSTAYCSAGRSTVHGFHNGLGSDVGMTGRAAVSLSLSMVLSRVEKWSRYDRKHLIPC